MLRHLIAIELQPQDLHRQLLLLGVDTYVEGGLRVAEISKKPIQIPHHYMDGVAQALKRGLAAAAAAPIAIRDGYATASAQVSKTLQPVTDYLHRANLQYKTTPQLEAAYQEGLTQLEGVAQKMPSLYAPGMTYLNLWRLNQMRHLAAGKAMDPHLMSGIKLIAEMIPEAPSVIADDTSQWEDSFLPHLTFGVSIGKGRPIVRPLSTTSTTPLMTAVDEPDEPDAVEFVWSAVPGLLRLPYWRTEIIEDWNFGRNQGRPIVGRMEAVPNGLDGYRKIQAAFLHATVEGTVIPLPTAIDDMGRPIVVYQYLGEKGSVVWLPEAGLFALKREDASAEVEAVMAYIPLPERQPHLTPYRPRPTVMPSRDKSHLSDFTRQVVEMVSAFGDLTKYGDYGLDVNEQVATTVGLLKDDWYFEAAPKGHEKLKTLGRNGLRLFHQSGGLMTANCGFANTELAEALRSIGIPTRIVHGFKDSENGGFTLPMHAWVEYFDGHYWRRADATPEARSLSGRSKTPLPKLAFLKASIDYPGLHPAHMALSNLPDPPSQQDLLAIVPTLWQSPPVFTLAPGEDRYRLMPDGRMATLNFFDSGARVVDPKGLPHVPVDVHTIRLGRIGAISQLGALLCRRTIEVDPLMLQSDLIDQPNVMRGGVREFLARHVMDQDPCGADAPLINPFASYQPNAQLKERMAKVGPKFLDAHLDNGRVVLDDQPSLDLKLIKLDTPAQPLQRALEAKTGRPWTPEDIVHWFERESFEWVNIGIGLLHRKAGLVIQFSLWGTSTMRFDHNRAWELMIIPYTGRVVATPAELISGSNIYLGIKFAEAIFAHTRGREVNEGDRALVTKALGLLLRHPPDRRGFYEGRISEIASIVYLLEAAQKLHITDDDVKVSVAGETIPLGLRPCEDLLKCGELRTDGMTLPETAHLSGLDEVYRYMVELISRHNFRYAYHRLETMDPFLRRWMDHYLKTHFDEE